MHAQLLLPAALLVAGSASCILVRENGRSVTPQRPTFSSDTGTTAEGSWELETGVDLDPGDALLLPTSLKFGLGPRTEVFATAAFLEPFDTPGKDDRGFSDLLLGGRHRFYASDAGTSLAVQTAVKLPTSSRSGGRSTGELDFFAAGIVTQAIEDSTVTGYYELGLLGDPNGSGTDDAHLLALAASHPLPHHLGVFGELAQMFGLGGADPAFATLGMTRTITKSFVLDGGVRLGLNGDASDAQVVFGLTTNFGVPGARSTGAAVE